MKAAKALENEVKNDNRKVAGWLLYYHERKKEYAEKREAVLHSTPNPEGPDGGQTFNISKTTERKGTKLADMQETEQWLALVEEVERRLPDKLAIYLRLRREYRHARGRNGWVAPVQHRYAEELAKLLNKRQEDVWIESRITFYRWWDRIVEYAARIAAKRGLL